MVPYDDRLCRLHTDERHKGIQNMRVRRQRIRAHVQPRSQGFFRPFQITNGKAVVGTCVALRSV